MSFDKKFFRKTCIAKRSEISEKDQKSHLIAEKLFQNKCYTEADTVFLYASSGDEVFTEEICRKAEKSGKKTAYPVCVDKNGNMIFYYSAFDNLIKGMYGIFEPDPELCKEASFDSKTLCIVPGVAFDKSGGRVGYGKGYYDRFLSSFTGKSIGLCFEECIFETVPADNHDKKVNSVITDKYIYTTDEEE